MPAAKKSWLDGYFPHVFVGAALGVAALLVGDVALREEAPLPPPPPRVAARKDAPAPAPAPAPEPATGPIAVTTTPGPLARPSEPAADAADRLSWERLLLKTDQYLVRQAVDAGVDGAREDRLRAAFAARRAARSADIADAEAGRIDKKTLRRRSAQAQSSLEREIDKILTPAERVALDVEAARAMAVAEER